MIIHIQTKVSTVFGIVDDKGNVVKQVPVDGTISGLFDDEFVKVATELREIKRKLEEQQNPV